MMLCLRKSRSADAQAYRSTGWTQFLAASAREQAKSAYAQNKNGPRVNFHDRKCCPIATHPRKCYTRKEPGKDRAMHLPSFSLRSLALATACATLTACGDSSSPYAQLPRPSSIDADGDGIPNHQDLFPNVIGGDE